MTLIAKTVWLLILVALIVGVAIGYGISIPEKQALQSKLQGLEQASKQVSQMQSELQKLSQENEQLKKQVSELQKKLNPNYVEKIKARGKLIVGTSADWPPFEYVNEKGQIVGTSQTKEGPLTPLLTPNKLKKVGLNLVASF